MRSSSSSAPWTGRYDVQPAALRPLRPSMLDRGTKAIPLSLQNVFNACCIARRAEYAKKPSVRTIASFQPVRPGQGKSGAARTRGHRGDRWSLLHRRKKNRASTGRSCASNGEVQPAPIARANREFFASS